MTTVNNASSQDINDFQEGMYVNVNDSYAIADVVEPILKLDELTQHRVFNLIQSETGVDLKQIYFKNQHNQELIMSSQKIKNENLKIEHSGDAILKNEISKNGILKNENQNIPKSEKSKSGIYQNKMRELQKGYMKLLSNQKN